MEQKEHEKRQDREANQEHETVVPCEHCGSDTHDDVVKAAFWSEGGLVAIEDIPARVCERCGEQLYSQDTARKIQQIIAEPPENPKEELLVPVFSLTEVEVLKTDSAPDRLDDEEVEAIEPMFTGMEQGYQEAEDVQETPEAYLCKYCECETYQDTVKSVLWTDKGLVAVEDIPARVCRECQEQFYDDETTWKIAKLRESGFPAELANRELLVPVFSLREVHVP